MANPAYPRWRDWRKCVGENGENYIDANKWSVPRRCIGRRVSVIAMPGGQVVVRMAGEEVAVHDAASGPSRPINYDPDHYGQALEGKRGLADADIAEAARANLALLDSLGGA